MLNRLDLLSDKDMEQIHRGVLRILSEAGMRFESERLLGILERGGAKIDPARHRAFFPPQMIERTLEQIKPLAKETKVETLVSRKLGDNFALDFGYETFFLYDWKTKDRRTAKEQDVIELMHLAEVLPEVGSVGLPVLNSATDPRIEALEAVALLLRHTSKHRGAGIRTPEQVPYLIEIDQLLGYTPSNPHFMQLGRCMISPLSFGVDACRIYEALIDHGYDQRFWVATMPIAGGTGPVTAAGTVALLVAEILGGWTLIKCINPEAAAEATVISGAMDMRKACATFSSPEAVLQDIAAAEFFRRRYGVEVGYDPGYTDAKVPGLQCAYEKTFKQMAFGLYLAPTLTVGSLEGGATFSPTQAMLEIEMNRGLWKFYQGIEVSEATLALDEIVEVCNSDMKSFLETGHTLANYSRALWYPEFLVRGPWTTGAEEWERGEKLLEEAEEKWREVLKDYEPPPVEEDQLREVEHVIERARAHLCG